jgi:hypothetical protein
MSRRRPCPMDWRSGYAHCRVLSGYGERHVRMVWFGTGETRLCSFVSRDRPDKPVVKPGGAQRESDGVVVPVIAGMHPAGGKGPDFDHGGEEGKRQGMTGVIRSNYPTGRLSGVAVRLMPDPANVRQLQNRLWAAAKQSSERRFHALYDRIYRGDVLWMAWERVRANRGAGCWRSTKLAFCDQRKSRCGVWGSCWLLMLVGSPFGGGGGERLVFA